VNRIPPNLESLLSVGIVYFLFVYNFGSSLKILGVRIDLLKYAVVKRLVSIVDVCCF
jgi:hypothetical protein